MTSFIDRIHGNHVHGRRVDVLAKHLARITPRGAKVLDVGCGDGLLAHVLLEARPDLSIEGIDVLVRSDARIPVRAFDGTKIPHADGSFDAVMFVDVLHHTDDPRVLLREASRVAKTLVIKDHSLEGWLAGPTLRAMDDVGNARHGVALPHNYWPMPTWLRAFEELGLAPTAMERNLGLYPRPFDWVFGRSLHFVARIERRASSA